MDPLSLKIDELKSLCRARGLPVSGLKDDLVKRLMASSEKEGPHIGSPKEGTRFKQNHSFGLRYLQRNRLQPYQQQQYPKNHPKTLRQQHHRTRFLRHHLQQTPKSEKQIKSLILMCHPRKRSRL
ncbi:hypothetical protein BC829DRAFT_249393 [Chytridium lagenaria]|nr:hypothetical protein BC829DRAFT_249393 [Chytridium lagenaria]